MYNFEFSFIFVLFQAYDLWKESFLLSTDS